MKLYIKTFGCRVNQSESQSILEQLEQRGMRLTNSYEDADVCVINTCTVTAKADKDVEKLLRLINARNKFARIFVTGCYAQIKKDKVNRYCANAVVVGNDQKANLVSIITGGSHCAGFGFSVTKSNERSRAFVKIQDGCSNSCAFCIVNKARNIKLSKPVCDAVTEIDNLINNGFSEIVLTGINVGSYKCPQTGAGLEGLLSEIFKINKKFRIRLSSIEPLDITDALIEVCVKAGDKFCEHFHMPLQAGSDAVLKRMNRLYTVKQYGQIVNKIRSAFKTPGVYADVIAGFPGETSEEFEEGLNYIKGLNLAGLHVFSFSPREGTPAAQMQQLPSEEIKNRAQTLREADGVLRQNFATSLVGTKQTVFIESSDIDSIGLAGNFQKVIIKCKELYSLVEIDIISAQKALCYGEVKK